MSRLPQGVRSRRLTTGKIVYDVNIRVGGVPVRPKGFASVDAARAAMTDARDRHRRGLHVLDAATVRVTVGELARRHLDAKSARWAPSTRDQKASEWGQLEPRFGARRVVEVRVTAVQDWLDGSPLTRDTLSGRLGLLRAILDRATVDYGIVNVARMAELPGVAPSARKFAPAAADVAKLVSWFDASPTRRPLHVGVVLALGLGLRSGEVRGLTLDRVDFATGAVTIDRQLVYVHARHGDPCGPGWTHVTGRWWLKPPKAASAGVVSAAPGLLEVVSAHVERFGTGPGGLILQTARGNPLSASVWQRALGSARAATGVTLKGHALRHAYASWALADGATVAEVQADLRHAKASTTLDFYVHADPPRDARRSTGVLARVDSVADAHKSRTRGHLRAV